MNLAQEAFKELYPDKTTSRIILVKYSGKFRPYNANVRYGIGKIEFSLATEWKEVSEEIVKGLIQSLLVKVFKDKRVTLNQDLYSKFIDNLPKFSNSDTVFDPELKVVFDRMNKEYFHDYLETPNLRFGTRSFSKLGSYEYLSNTITISTILKGADELLDYVMYHEMLHKSLGYIKKGNRNHHHTPEFRRREKMFSISNIEEQLTKFVKKKRLRDAFRFF